MEPRTQGVLWAIAAFVAAVVINQVGFEQGVLTPAQRVPYIGIELVLAITLGVAVYANASLGVTRRAEQLEQAVEAARTGLQALGERVNNLQTALNDLTTVTTDQLRELRTLLEAVPTAQQLIDLEERAEETANRTAIAIHDQLVPRIIQLEGLSATKKEEVA